MTSVVDRIRGLPFLECVPKETLEASRRYWVVREAPAGEPLWERGTPANELAVVLEGELVARVEGTEVGRVQRGEMIGEVAAFLSGATRSASLVPTEPTLVLALRGAGLLALRRQASPVYDALLEHALVTLARRVRALDARISLLLKGDREPPQRLGAAELRDALELGDLPAPRPPAPPLTPLLRRLPGLSELEESHLLDLVGAFRPRAFQQGQALFLQGDAGDAIYVLAEGEIDVVRQVFDGRAVSLARLRPGDPFGANALVEPGRRTAACVARTPVWTYRLDAKDDRALRGPIRRAWQESLLATLATQVRIANDVIVRATSRREPGAELEPAVFRELLLAWGALEALPMSQAGHAEAPASAGDLLERPGVTVVPRKR